jgi:hypothetical protein
MVVALVALFVSLAGTGFAAVTLVKLANNSVGTPQIKNGAVTRPKLNRHLLAQLAGKAGPRGVAGPRGPKGDTGLTGPPVTTVAARPRSVGSVTTSAGGTADPLGNATWTQAANELDLLLLGTVTVTNPSSSPGPCAGGTHVTVKVTVGSKSGSASAPIPASGTTATEDLFWVAQPEFFEPGSPTSRTATATVSDNCASGDLIVNSLAFDMNASS